MEAATDEEMLSFERGAALPMGTFVGDGPFAVARMLEAGVVRLLVGPAERLRALNIPADVPARTATDEQLGRIHGARYHSGLMALGTIPPERALGKRPWVVLDGVKDAENVGTIFRTCAALGVGGVLYSADACSPWNRRSVRVSMGAVLAVPSQRVVDLPHHLRTLKAYAAHPQPQAPAHWQVDWLNADAVVLGAEDVGVRPQVLAACVGMVCIPMESGWDSLNVAACAAVILSEAQRQSRR